MVSASYTFYKQEKNLFFQHTQYVDARIEFEKCSTRFIALTQSAGPLPDDIDKWMNKVTGAIKQMEMGIKQKDFKVWSQKTILPLLWEIITRAFSNSYLMFERSPCFH